LERTTISLHPSGREQVWPEKGKAKKFPKGSFHLSLKLKDNISKRGP